MRERRRISARFDRVLRRRPSHEIECTARSFTINSELDGPVAFTCSRHHSLFCQPRYSEYSN